LDVLACLLPLPCWPYLPLIQTRILLCKQTWQVLPLRTHFFLYPSTFVLLGVRWLWKSLYEKLQRQLEHLLPGLSIPGSSQVTFSSKGPVQSNKLSAKASLVLPLGTFLEWRVREVVLTPTPCESPDSFVKCHCPGPAFRESYSLVKFWLFFVHSLILHWRDTGVWTQSPVLARHKSHVPSLLCFS
jgi:hypothetical protein